MRALRRELALRVVVAERAVVRREQREHALLQALPARPAWLAVSRGGGEQTYFAPSMLSAVHVLLGQHEILRTGLAVDLEAALLRAADFLHRLAVGDVDDHDRHVDQSRQARWRGASPRARPGSAASVRVDMGRGLAGALQPVGEEADGVVVLGMHHHQRAGLARHAS